MSIKIIKFVIQCVKYCDKRQILQVLREWPTTYQIGDLRSEMAETAKKQFKRTFRLKILVSYIAGVAKWQTHHLEGVALTRHGGSSPPSRTAKGR